MAKEKEELKDWYICHIGLIDFRKVLKICRSGIYVPRVVEKRVMKKRIKDIEKALYPGYIFINSFEAYNKLKRCFSQIYLLQYKGTDNYSFLYKLTDEELKGIMKMEKDTQRKKTDYKVGDKIRISQGPFLGMIGKVIEIKKNCVKFNIHFMNRDLDMQMDIKDVEIL